MSYLWEIITKSRLNIASAPRLRLVRGVGHVDGCGGWRSEVTSGLRRNFSDALLHSDRVVGQGQGVGEDGAHAGVRVRPPHGRDGGLLVHLLDHLVGDPDGAAGGLGDVEGGAAHRVPEGAASRHHGVGRPDQRGGRVA